jgi:hypothetical protein
MAPVSVLRKIYTIGGGPLSYVFSESGADPVQLLRLLSRHCNRWNQGTLSGLVKSDRQRF